MSEIGETEPVGIGEPLVLRDVVVFSAFAEGDDVLVDLYGGTASACTSVRLHPHPSEHRRTVEQLERWRAASCPLTLHAHGRAITLSHLTVSS